jgi:cell division protein ZapD
VNNQYINFEQPLTERMRLFLRVEYLAKKLEHFRMQEHGWESSTALTALVELFSLFERNDIKSEIAKELERHIQRLTRLQGMDGVDGHALNNILNELQHHSRTLQQSAGKLGQVIRDDELLNSVRQRLTIPGGTCSFDTPSFYYWLHIPFSMRQALFNQWLAPFNPLSQALNLLLHLTRESARLQPEIATQGFYQKTIEMSASCPLVQIQLDKNLGVYPEISGGKYRVSIRFWQFMPTPPHNIPCNLDIAFQIRCCSV